MVAAWLTMKEKKCIVWKKKKWMMYLVIFDDGWVK